MKNRKLNAIVDTKYQGLVSGNLEQDSFAIRHFNDEGIKMFIVQ